LIEWAACGRQAFSLKTPFFRSWKEIFVNFLKAQPNSYLKLMGAEHRNSLNGFLKSHSSDETVFMQANRGTKIVACIPVT